MLALSVLAVLLAASTAFAAEPSVVSDKLDYFPGEQVTLLGSGWEGDSAVRVQVDDAIGDVWWHDVTVPVDSVGMFIDQFWLPAQYVPLYNVTVTGVDTERVVTATFTDSGGAYTLKLSAADPVPNRGTYAPTYDKLLPQQLAAKLGLAASPWPWLPPGGRRSDPLEDAVAYGPAYLPSNLDAVQSLMPKDLALGQVVPFELEIKVNGNTTPENGVIHVTAEWLAKTTSGDDFGFSTNYKLIAAFVDAGDVGTVDPGGDAKVDSLSSVTVDEGTRNERIVGDIQVSGLQSGDNVIVELWVVLKDSLHAGTSGNVQTSLVGAHTVATTEDKITVGNQTVPLLQASDFLTNDAELSIEKSDTGYDPVDQGSDIQYQISVTNAGPTTANGVVVTDQLDPNVTYKSFSPSTEVVTEAGGIVTWNVGSVPVGETKSLSVVVGTSKTTPYNNNTTTVADEPGGRSQPAAGTYDVLNGVSVSSDYTDDTIPADNTWYEPTNILRAIHIPTPPTIEKTASPTSVPESGGTVTFTVRITNDDSEPILLDSVTDDVYGDLNNTTPKPVGATWDTSTCDIPSGGRLIAVDAYYEFTFTASVSGEPSTTEKDTATAVGYNENGDSESEWTVWDDADVTLTNDTPTIDVTKTALTTSLAEPGGSVTFKVEIENTSVSSDPVSISSVTDAIGGATAYSPALFTDEACTSAASLPFTIQPGDDPVTLYFKADVEGDPKTVNDVVTASGTDDENTAVSDFDDADVEITDTAPTVSITKSASPGTISEPGGNVTYTYVITNTSTFDEPVKVTALVDSKLGDLMADADVDWYTSADVSIPDISAYWIAEGASVKAVVTKYLDADYADGSISNRIDVTVTDEEDATATDYDNATVTVTDVAPTFSITKTPAVTTIAEPGGPVVMTVVVTNNSTFESIFIDQPTALSDTPAWVAGSLKEADGTPILAFWLTPREIEPGGTWTFKFTVNITGDPDDYTDTASVTARDNDGASDTQTAQATVAITDTAPTITVEKSASPGTISEPGGNVTYTYVITNTSTFDEPVKVTALVDSKLGDLMADADVDWYTSADVSIPDISAYWIAEGASVKAVVTKYLDADYADGSISNRIDVTVTDEEDATATDYDNATVTVTDVAPGFTVTKTPAVTSLYEPGGPVVMTVTVHNDADETLYIKSLADLSDSPAWISGTLSAITFPVEIAPDAEFIFTFSVDISGDFGEYKDTVFVTGYDNDSTTGVTETAQATVTLLDSIPTIQVTKTPSMTSVPFTGASVTFTFTVKNLSTVEPVTITKLYDSEFGDLPGDADCYVRAVLQPGQEVTLTYTHVVSGEPGGTHSNTFTGEAQDDDDNTADDDASVNIPLYWYGFTPGYWKQKQHFSSWPTGYYPIKVGANNATTVRQVFTVPASLLTTDRKGKVIFDLNGDGTEDTLLDALNYKGGNDPRGKAQILLRAAVAGLFNCIKVGPGYPAFEDAAALIEAVNGALAGSEQDMVSLGKTLDDWNNGAHELP